MSVRGGLAFVALATLWGIPYLLIKVAVSEVPSVCVAWCNLTLAALVLLPIAAPRREVGCLHQHWRAIWALALLQLAVPSLLIALSERWIRSSLAGTLVATVPLLVIPMAPLFGVRQSLSLRGAAGLLVGFAGVSVLLGLDVPHGSYAWVGVICMLLAALAYAAAPLIIQRHLRGIPGIGPSAASLAIACVVLFPGALWSLPSTVPSPAAIASLAGLGVMCYGMGMLLYFFLIHEVGAARASVVKYVSPAIAAALGTMVLGEPLTLSSLIGLLMILVGSWWAAHAPAHGGATPRLSLKYLDGEQIPPRTDAYRPFHKPAGRRKSGGEQPL